jgi:hypothetical protein
MIGTIAKYIIKGLGALLLTIQLIVYLKDDKYGYSFSESFIKPLNNTFLNFSNGYFIDGLFYLFGFFIMNSFLFVGLLFIYPRIFIIISTKIKNGTIKIINLYINIFHYLGTGWTRLFFIIWLIYIIYIFMNTTLVHGFYFGDMVGNLFFTIVFWIIVAFIKFVYEWVIAGFNK